MDKTQLRAEETALLLERDMRQRAEARNAKLQAELAASQAREEQLRDELFAVLVQDMSGDKARLKVEKFKSDTSALEALISQASEVMQERCSLSVLLEHGGPEDECRPALEECSEAIRALPGVTLGDLQK